MIKNMYFFERIFAIQVSDYCEEGFDALEEQVPHSIQFCKTWTQTCTGFLVVRM